MKPKKAYICSPYRADTKEGIQKNIELAKKACKHCIYYGYIPIAPHIYFTQYAVKIDKLTKKRLCKLVKK